MTRTETFLWSAAVLTVACLNIVDVLPDWATITAVLTLPAIAATRASACCPGGVQ